MKTFPMIRTKWSNEHIMAALLCVLALYHLPGWVDGSSDVLRFLLLGGTGLAIDLAASLIRHRRVWCCISGGVTAAMISLLTMGVPLWAQMAGIAAALILGKHIWGGTGKNLLNPAMVGLLVVMLLSEVSYPFFPPSLLLLPALLFSIPFLRSRPFAGIAFLIGMTAVFYLNQTMSLEVFLSGGVLFWSCLVMTDPVTVTLHPVAGAAIGFLAGLGVLLFEPMPIAYVVSILSVNLFSAVMERVPEKALRFTPPKLRIPKVIKEKEKILPTLDLTGEENRFRTKNSDTVVLTSKEIIERMKRNEVFGMGGAAFPAWRKLESTLSSKAARRYLIINGVECDPGLIHDDWLLQNRSDEISRAAELIASCGAFHSIYLAVKKKENLNYWESILLYQVPEVYPAGAEQLLIHEILKKKVPLNELPADHGILVYNVQTVFMIYQAVIQNQPVKSRYLTVADLFHKTARVVRAPLDMKIVQVMEAAFPGVMSVFAGGGIMQSGLADEEDIVGRTVNFVASGIIPEFKESPQCSHCGECVKYCPVGLKVNRIADLADQGREAETAKYYVNECIQCGSCSYSCLAGRNLSAKVKAAKDVVSLKLIQRSVNT